MSAEEQAQLSVVHILAELLADTKTAVEACTVIEAVDREAEPLFLQNKAALDAGTPKAANENKPVSEYTDDGELSIGQQVYISGEESPATIVDLSDDKAVVRNSKGTWEVCVKDDITPF